jgi:hypothetical protein
MFDYVPNRPEEVGEWWLPRRKGGLAKSLKLFVELQAVSYLRMVLFRFFNLVDKCERFSK